jgi:pyroglutamyl-peptidase
MPKILLTAFQPYDRWPTNASWLTLVELTRDLPTSFDITTRLYPVDYDAVRSMVRNDLAANYDVVVHLGQAPESSRLRLEMIGLNARMVGPNQFGPLTMEGPVAYQSNLPLVDWAAKIRHAGIPAEVSFHAGTYLCNALLYFSLQAIEELALSTEAMFLHVPLDVSQVVNEREDVPSLPVELSARALRMILEEIQLS